MPVLHVDSAYDVEMWGCSNWGLTLTHYELAKANGVFGRCVSLSIRAHAYIYIYIYIYFYTHYIVCILVCIIYACLHIHVHTPFCTCVHISLLYGIRSEYIEQQNSTSKG